MKKYISSNSDLQNRYKKDVETCHDSRDSRGDSPTEEVKSVASNLFRSSPFLALGTRGNHARLKKDTLKQHIVLSQVEEHLGPNLLSNLECPVDTMLTIEKDLWLHNWDQPIVLNMRKMIKNQQFLDKFEIEHKGHEFNQMFVCLFTWVIAA